MKSALFLLVLTMTLSAVSQRPSPQTKPSAAKGGWKTGSTIHVYFKNGNAKRRGFFANCVKEWSQYGNFTIHFHPEKKLRVHTEFSLNSTK